MSNTPTPIFIVLAHRERHPDLTPSPHRAEPAEPMAAFHNRDRAEGYAKAVRGWVREVPLE